MTGLAGRLGLLVDTWDGSARMRRYAQGWPATASPGVSFFRTRQVQFRYRVAGEGPAIVFSVDPPMTLETYDRLFHVFAPRFRAIAVELPAMGFSAVAPGFSFGFRETNDALAEFLAEIAGPSAILAFSCAAGLAAIDIAVRRPELVSHLALLQAGDVEAFAVWKAGRDPKKILAKPIIGQVVMKRLAPKRMPQWYKLSVGDTARIGDFCACAERSFDHGAMWSLASAYQVYLGANVKISAPRQPMLSLWGEADKSHPASNAHSLRRLRPDIVCGTFPDLGHTPELESPERVLQSIAQFMGR